MKLLTFILRTLVFVAFTFAFLVIFQYGIGDFPAGAQKEWDYWTGKKPVPTAEN